MIEKQFINSNCISCGRETPVTFIVKDINGEQLYRIPLCRCCSNIFAEDVINSLRTKLEKSHAIISSKRGEIHQLKYKVQQMNYKSHNHKEIITSLLKTEK